MRKLVFLMVLALLAPAALTACGGGDDETTPVETNEPTTTTQAGGGGGGGGGGGTISVSADPGGALAFEQTSLSAQAGSNTIEFDNPAPVAHDVCVEDPSAKELGCSDVITEDNTSLTVDLEPGTYTYYCDVDAHRAGGMEGTLTVE
jgi:plastocyanin